MDSFELGSAIPIFDDDNRFMVCRSAMESIDNSTVIRQRSSFFSQTQRDSLNEK